MLHARSTHRPQGPATVLAIGTAAPSDIAIQAEVPDRIFKGTNRDHLAELKMKFTRICKKSLFLMFILSLLHNRRLYMVKNTNDTRFRNRVRAHSL